MHLLVFVLCGLLASEGSAAQAQQEDPEGVLDLGETIITPTASERAPMDVPFSGEVISEQQMARRAYRTTPEALRDVPGILLQETAVGHGSPYIRGFTSFRNLFLVDGIRLNNSVFRSGPNQYWNTVDPLLIESLEVVKGPGSVLYGSDSIGGTVNARTRMAYRSSPDDSLAGKLVLRHSSAEQSFVGRLEGSLLGDNGVGVLMGLGGKSFGDLVAGGSTGTQPGTGYDEVNGDLKLDGTSAAGAHWTFAMQHLAQNDVPRTHKTDQAISFHGTTIGSDQRRDLDQERTLVYGQVRGETDAAFFDRYFLSLSWHRQEETRQRTKSNSSRSEQGFDVGQAGLLGNLSSDTSFGRLTYGFDYYHDDVDSFSSEEPVQGPVADDASYDLFGLYIQDEVALSRSFDVILGLRYNYAAADANSVLDPLTSSQVSIEDDWNALLGSLRFLWRWQEEVLHVFGGVSQGFRTPNLSDLTRLDSARSNEYEIPSPGLDPERSTSFELGVKSRKERLSAELAVFYTVIEDQIVRFPTGNTNGSGELEITKDNLGDGYVSGIELGAAYEMAPQWTVFGNAAYQYGRVDTYPTSAQVLTSETITRLMPFSAQAGVLWEVPGSDGWIEAQFVYAATADRLNTRDQSDTSRIPPGGTPEYLLAHVRAGLDLADGVTLNVAFENLGDVNYRVHGSGQNGPGRNLTLGLTLSF